MKIIHISILITSVTMILVFAGVNYMFESAFEKAQERHAKETIIMESDEYDIYDCSTQKCRDIKLYEQNESILESLKKDG